jgi:hypothetical protein
MPKTTLADHDVTKRAVQYLLRNGLCTYAEISAVSGRSRQMVRFWSQELGAESTRQERVKRLWAKALRAATAR